MLGSFRLGDVAREEATGLVSRFPDQSISLFDATLATVASRLGLPVWTYDHHFDSMKTAVWR